MQTLVYKTIVILFYRSKKFVFLRNSCVDNIFMIKERYQVTTDF